MGLPRFFKLKEPNRFDYQPLYWDPEKEEREERVRRIKAELGHDVGFTHKSSTIGKGSFRQYRSGSVRKKAGRDSNLRLIIIAAVLIILAYLLFYR